MVFRILPCLALLMVGCAGGQPPAPVHPPVTGNVTLNGKPLAGATVQFVPTGSTVATTATGTTDDSGNYTLSGPRGGQGAAPGEYKVAISLWLMKDGKRPAPDVPPANSGATESLPATYSSLENTTLKATVPSGGGKIDFALKKR